MGSVCALGQPTSGPPLEVQVVGANALVSWTNGGGEVFWLQATEFLDDPTPWYNAPWPITDQGIQHFSAVPMDSDARFFRLVASLSLPPPTVLRVQAGSDALVVTWNSVSNAASYNLYMASAPGLSHLNYTNLPDGILLPGLTDTMYVFNSLSNGVRYYCVATAVSTNGIESADSNEDSDLFGQYGQVHGSIYTEFFDGTQTNQIPLQGVGVSIIETNTGNTTLLATDASGNFAAGPLLAGTYQFCWQASGFVSGCSTQQIVLTNGVVYLDPERIDAISSNGVVFGQVLLADGGPALASLPMFGIEVSATVRLRAADGRILRSGQPNSSGEYFLAGIPVGTNLLLSADMEASHVETNILTAAANAVTLILPNHAPDIQSVATLVGLQPVFFAPPGSNVTVEVTATDVENHPLHYRWLPELGADGLTTNDAATVSCLLPGVPGTVRASVLVSDGHGGYASGQFEIGALTNMQFSGTVCGPDNILLSNAQISVNSHLSTSDTTGNFSLEAPATEETFLLTITATGYVPLSRNFTESSVGQTYCLSPLPVLCTNWSGEEIEFADAAGTLLRIQANSLLYAGFPYVGPICVRISTFDPCSNYVSFPSSYDAVDLTNGQGLLLPNSAAMVEITDPSGQPLTIDPGLPATIEIPLGQTCSTNAGYPAFPPILEWDEINGVWRIIGQATRTIEPGGAVIYIAPVIQLGMMAVGEVAQKTTVTAEPDKTINQPFLLRLSSQPDPVLINTPVRSPKPRNQFVVPRDKAVTIEILSPKEGPGEFFTNPNDAATIRATKDKTAIFKATHTFTNETASFRMSLTKHIPALKRDVFDELNDINQFLNHELPPNNQSNAFGVVNNRYYAAVGPNWRPNHNSFSEWLVKNGFIPANSVYPTNYSDDAHALYFNATDLGFARSMHMKKTSGADGKTNIAYYVINYRSLEDALSDKAEKEAPEMGSIAVATVAMDYAWDPIFKKRYTKFYVFDAGFSGSLRPEADLDGNGNRSVPNLCVVCHGNEPVKAVKEKGQIVMKPPDGDVDARFIPFDIEAFTYDKAVGVQKDQFRELNRGIYLYTPMSDATKKLIETWYGGPLTPNNNNNFAVNAVPTDWAGEAALYRDTVRISCRGCHVMRDGAVAFGKAGEFTRKGRKGLICSSLKMPNAQRTFSIFWGSHAANFINPGSTPDQPAALTNKFGWSPCPEPRP